MPRWRFASLESVGSSMLNQFEAEHSRLSVLGFSDYSDMMEGVSVRCISRDCYYGNAAVCSIVANIAELVCVFELEP